jgi:large subunit ribosomal protein L5e
MPYIKVVKTKAYFKRFQVKFKRRREGKTDYYARRRLVIQDKNKYNSPKYRFVVRFTNTDIICQIIFATLSSDRVMTASYAHELPRYGVKGGLTNYAAAYATGLLCARRVLTKLNLASVYVGKEKADGKEFLVKEIEGQNRPFYVLLDVGLNRTTTGSRVFAAMKGAVDGGLEIPHNNKRFAGYDNEAEKFDPGVLRKHIFGVHVADYMRLLQSENPEKYQRQFSEYVKNKVTADDIEKMWERAHKGIREDPVHKPKAKPEKPYVHKHFRPQKRNLKQRKNRIKQILAAQERAAVH